MKGKNLLQTAAFCFLGLFCFVGYAQNETDTTIRIETKKNAAVLIDSAYNRTSRAPFIPKPGRAARFSMLCPGLGQIYNRKYWKLPIVYGVMGGLTVLAVRNHVEYARYQKAYIYRTDNNPATIDEFKGLLDDSAVRVYRNGYRRDRDLMLIFLALGYTLNILDAYVDAH